MKITLARALKIKNILAGKVPVIQSAISVGNSVAEGTEQPDIRALIKKRTDTVGHLVSLKTRIDELNAPIRNLIYTLAEAKASLVFWNGLCTTNGDTGEVHYGSNTKIIKTAVVRKEELEAIVASLASEIEELQEKIDQHNFKTVFEVNDELLALAGVKR